MLRPAEKRASAMLQAFAAGLQADQQARDAGHADGLAWRHWSPGDRDEFSYALGYAAGRAKARRHNGDGNGPNLS